MAGPTTTTVSTEEEMKTCYSSATAEVCTKSPAHALVSALALLTEGNPVAKNLLGAYRLDLRMFIGHDEGMGH